MRCREPAYTSSRYTTILHSCVHRSRRIQDALHCTPQLRYRRSIVLIRLNMCHVVYAAGSVASSSTGVEGVHHPAHLSYPPTLPYSSVPRNTRGKWNKGGNVGCCHSSVTKNLCRPVRQIDGFTQKGPSGVELHRTTHHTHTSARPLYSYPVVTNKRGTLPYPHNNHDWTLMGFNGHSAHQTHPNTDLSEDTDQIPAPPSPRSRRQNEKHPILLEAHTDCATHAPHICSSVYIHHVLAKRETGREG